MILYTNGDGHTAAACAVNEYEFAEEDKTYWNLERRPHPANLAVSWGPQLADLLKMSFHTDAEAGLTNQQIIERTKAWLETSSYTLSDVFVIIGWGKHHEGDHDAIYEFHDQLLELGVKHLFFNAVNSFASYVTINDRHDWGASYIGPYTSDETYTNHLHNDGYDTVITSNEYFGPGAHAAWAKHLLKYIVEHKLV